MILKRKELIRWQRRSLFFNTAKPGTDHNWP